MADLKTIAPKVDHPLHKADPVFLAKSRRRAPEDPRQRGLMVGSLGLLLFALGIVLWHDRNFWFPDTPEAESAQPPENSTAAKITPAQPSATVSHRAKAAKPKRQVAKNQAATNQVATRQPAMEAEVPASTRPGSSSVRVELQPDTPPQPATGAGTAGDSETAANATGEAAERVQMSATTSDNVASPARQPWRARRGPTIRCWRGR